MKPILKPILKKIILPTLIVASCLFTGCSSDTLETEEDQVQTPTPVIITSTPTPEVETDEETVTASGVAVEIKYEKYKVVQGVNIRSDCSGDSELKGSLYGGEIVQGTGVCENGWIQILYNGERCYVTGSCLEVTQEGDPILGDETQEDDQTAQETQTPQETTRVTVTPSPDPEDQPAHSVVDWAKYTSSKWEASGDTSCFVQIHSVAGNEVVLSFRVIDGSLEEEDQPGTLVAKVSNCSAKITDGVMNFTFTDDQGNQGIGRMEIVDDTHLSITTFIETVNASAKYKAEVMTELTEVEE